MPETTHCTLNIRTPYHRPNESRDGGFFLPHPSLLEAIAPTALRLQAMYRGVRGGDSPDAAADALTGQRTALRQLCDSLQLEGRPAGPEEIEARRALIAHELARGDMSPERVAEALQVLQAALDRLLASEAVMDLSNGGERAMNRAAVARVLTLAADVMDADPALDADGALRIAVWEDADAVYPGDEAPGAEVFREARAALQRVCRQDITDIPRWRALDAARVEAVRLSSSS
ncbi:hypothetical protein ACFRDV_22185 [Streptomyces fagopyri]|uniref:hypothetical protein n=1 Tax=Streptomyces fagopyri TaxID=2662397 RepID=UPI0036862EF1